MKKSIITIILILTMTAMLAAPAFAAETEAAGKQGSIDIFSSGNFLTVSADDLNKLGAAKDLPQALLLNSSEQKGVYSLSVSPDTLKTLADDSNDVQTVQFTLDLGTITMDKKAVKSLLIKSESKPVTIELKYADQASAAGDAKLLCEAEGKTAVFGFKTENTKIKSLDGTVSISLNTDGTIVNPRVYTVDESGSMKYIKSVKDGTSIVITPKYFSQFSVISFPFTDIPFSAWYHNDTAYAWLSGLYSGTSASTFSPSRSMTRGMLWTVIARFAGEKTDLPTNVNYYDSARSWAMAKNLSDGNNPNGNITRAQLAAILYRYAVLTGQDVSAGESADISSFSDADIIPDYALTAMKWACYKGILQGSDGKLEPNANATRAQVAAILNRYAHLGSK